MNVMSLPQLSPKWLSGNSCTLAHYSFTGLWFHETVHHMPNCMMNCKKVIWQITRRVHCFHDYMYIMFI